MELAQSKFGRDGGMEGSWREKLTLGEGGGEALEQHVCRKLGCATQ